MRIKGRNLVELESTDRDFLLRVLKNDSEFLKGLGVMDYSLLLAIEKKNKNNNLLKSTMTGAAGHSEVRMST